MGRRASTNAVLLARASVARRLVREGKLDGEIGLSLVMWPTDGILAREAKCPDVTLRARAYNASRT